MRIQIDEMNLLLKKHKITAPTSTKKADHIEDTEDTEYYFETCHALYKGQLLNNTCLSH